MNKPDYVEEAPYHPGYEDAVVPPKQVYSGMDAGKMIWKPKPLDIEQIVTCAREAYGFTELTKEDLKFVKAIEERHGIK